jgi:hypothetical protein
VISLRVFLSASTTLTTTTTASILTWYSSGQLKGLGLPFAHVTEPSARGRSTRLRVDFALLCNTFTTATSSLPRRQKQAGHVCIWRCPCHSVTQKFDHMMTHLHSTLSVVATAVWLWSAILSWRLQTCPTYHYQQHQQLPQVL